MAQMRLETGKSVLLVVDMQERLLAAMPEAAGAEAAACTAQLVRGAGHLSVPVIVTEQYPKGLGSTAAPVAEALAELPAPFQRFEKLDFDVTRDATILEALKATGATQVVLAGMESHICVHQSARGLVSQGFEVHVALDATCSRDPRHVKVAQGLWRDDGAIVNVVESVLFDWLARAGGDAFKAISRLIK
ncbi:MAG: isochorismatase family protein [Deltaproteobacteria bacterium]|nr:isochorismatase family protein [Deltaproteobacteria bacterium]